MPDSTPKQRLCALEKMKDSLPDSKEVTAAKLKEIREIDPDLEKGAEGGPLSDQQRKFLEKTYPCGEVYKGVGGRLMTNTKYGPAEVKVPGKKDDGKDQVEIDD